MRTITRLMAASAAAVLALSTCGDNPDRPSTTSSSSATTASTTVAATTTTTTAVLEQAAIWPAASVYFATPEAAAKDFVEKALKVPATLGEFQAGDSRSGEMEVFSPGEGGSATRVVRGRLLLRQLGARSGWFVLASVNDNATISSPAQGSKVAAGPVSVSGKARGFEANVVVSARLAGHTETLSSVVTQGGAFETPMPYAVSLDLSGAKPGDVVLLLVRGGTGLETDPGEFGAVAVVVQ